MVGIFLAGLFCIQCTRTEAFRQSEFVVAISGKTLGHNAPETVKSLEALAKTDHIALLERCVSNYEGSYKDFTCTFIKQERLNGSLKPEQWIDVKFMEAPFSVAMRWTKNAPLGDRVIYVEGKYGNNMLVNPKGVLSALVGTVTRKPDDAQAMQNTLRPVNMFGFKRGMDNLLNVYRKARNNGDLKEEFGGYAKVAGRDTLVLVRHLPPKGDYPSEKTITYIDLDYMLPVCIEGYNWQGELVCRYIYKDIQFNVALNDADFLPETNGMKAPKQN